MRFGTAVLVTSYIWHDADLITTLRELDFRIFNSRTGLLVTSSRGGYDVSVTEPWGVLLHIGVYGHPIYYHVSVECGVMCHI